MRTRRAILAFLLVAAVGCGDSKKSDKASATGGKSDLSNLDDSKGAFKKPKAITRGNTRRGGGRMEEFHQLPFKTAKLVFEQKGMIVGKLTVWIDDHGSTIVVEQDLTKPGRTHNKLVWKNGMGSMWDLQGKNKRVHVSRLRSKATELRLGFRSEAQMQTAGYSKKGTETVAGQPCTVWENPKAKVKLCRWHDIDIKIENRAFRNKLQTTIATSIEPNATIPADVATPPAGYELPKKK